MLLQFPFTRPWGEQANAYVWGVVVTIGSGILRAIPDLLIAIAIFLVARGFIGLFKPAF